MNYILFEADGVYMPYEVPMLVNQTIQKLRVFDLRFEGHHPAILLLLREIKETAFQ